MPVPTSASTSGSTLIPRAQLSSAAAALPSVPTATMIGTAETKGARSSRVVVQANPDGCDRAYGTAGQCVPLRAGGGGMVTCAYLTGAGWFRVPLQVHADPLGLLTKKKVVAHMNHQLITVSGCTD